MSWWVGVDGDNTEDNHFNVTYNESAMYAESFGVSMWVLHGTRARDALKVLLRAQERMTLNWAKYEAMNPDNGWGDADNAFKVITTLARLCVAHPEGTVYVS